MDSNGHPPPFPSSTVVHYSYPASDAKQSLVAVLPTMALSHLLTVLQEVPVRADENETWDAYHHGLGKTAKGRYPNKSKCLRV